jgi:hypothetical protein
MKALFSTAISLFASMAMATAASTPTKFTSDALEFGHYGSTANKSLIYNFGLSTNPTTSVDNSTHTWSYNYNGLQFGDGTASDKTITANIGGSNPAIKYSNSLASWEFSNDGTNYQTFGSGSGGGGGINLLSNPNFETGLGNWTTSGLTSAAVTSGSNLLFGLGSATLTATAGAQYFEQSVAIPQGLGGTNCAVSVYYKGGDANMALHFTDSSNNDLGAAIALSPATTTTQVVLNGICPAAASNAKIRFVSTSSTALTAIDNAYLGSASNIYQVSQAQWVGSVHWTGTTSCQWQTSASSWNNFSAVSACPFPTAAGAVTALGTKIPGLSLPSVGPGVYRFEAHGGFLGGGASSFYARFSDGTNFSFPSDVVHTAAGTGLLSGKIAYTAPQSNVTIQIQGYSESGDNESINSDEAGQRELSIDVYYYPTQAQVVQNACGSTGSCVNHLSASVATDCTSSPCTIAQQNVPWLSSIVRTGAGQYTANLTTNTNVPMICYGSSVYNQSSVLIVAAVSTSAITFVTSTPGVGYNDSSFTIACDKQGTDISSVQAPVVVGGISSRSLGHEDIERAQVTATCSSSPCTIASSTPGISSITRTGTGVYVVNFAAGTFKATPTCTFDAFNFAGTQYTVADMMQFFSTNSSTQVTFSVANFSATPVDSIFGLVCMGPQ